MDNSRTGQFLAPWTAGRNKDYSNNKDYAVGVKIITEWEAAYDNATVTLWQDNHPGDAQGGPSVILQGKSSLLSLHVVQTLKCFE